MGNIETRAGARNGTGPAWVRRAGGWSDDRPETHTIVLPASDARYTALPQVPCIPSSAGNTSTSFPGTNMSVPDNGGRVVITGVQIPFGDMVVLILKFVLASIPAYIVIFIFIGILSAIFGGLLTGLMGAG